MKTLKHFSAVKIINFIYISMKYFLEFADYKTLLALLKHSKLFLQFSMCYPLIYFDVIDICKFLHTEIFSNISVS